MVVLLLRFGAWKLTFWSLNVAVACGHMNDFIGTFFGDDFSRFCRSSDDLSIDKGGFLMRYLEAQVPRLESYYHAWWSLDARKPPFMVFFNPTYTKTPRTSGPHRQRQL